MRYAHAFVLLLTILYCAMPARAQAAAPCDEANAPAALRAQLAADREQISAHHWHFAVGCTGIALRDIKDITGYGLPSPGYLNSLRDAQNGIAAQILRLEQKAISEFEKAADSLGLAHLPEVRLKASLPHVSVFAFDWTALGKVSPVRDQTCTADYAPGETCPADNVTGCGSCWAFASISALESSLLIRYNASARLSPQYVIDNVLYGSCSEQGGFPPEAFTQMMVLGTAKESDVPYHGKKFGPRSVFDNPYRALIWGFVGNSLIPSDLEMKEALLLHGPLAVAINATPRFGRYRGGVYDAYEEGLQTNHVVTLVGWDDTKRAWRIKNSWGPGWGENGFAWLAYRSNNIGEGVFWVEALNTQFQLPPQVAELLNRAKQLADDAYAAEQRAEKQLADARDRANAAAVEATKAATDAAGKAAIAIEKQRLADDAERQVTGAVDNADRVAKRAVAKTARAAANQANKEAAAARKSADHLSQNAKDAVKAASNLASVKLPKIPDPTKHWHL